MRAGGLTTTTIHRAIMLVVHAVTIAATSMGNRQYPSRHMDWKKPMFPPSSTTFTVSTTAPAAHVPKTNCAATEA